MRKMIKKYVTWILMLALFITFMPNASVQAKPLKKWEKAYLKELKKNNLSNARAKLLYIDNDDVPEILVGGHNKKDEFIMVIYSYYKGKVYKNYINIDHIYTGVLYVKKTGYIQIAASAGGDAINVAGVLKKGKIYYKLIKFGDEHGFETSGLLNEVWINPKVNNKLNIIDYWGKTGEKHLNDDETYKIYRQKTKYKASKYKYVESEKSLKKVMKQLRHEK